MSEGARPKEQWAPASAADRTRVLKELDAILASYHFRGSKRYPALLKYVVRAALDGHASDVKERTLGVEVFGRDPDYDTSADPVVRFTASEVRKRIAQYYHENGTATALQIELPRGSYVPEFLFREPETVVDQNDANNGQSASSHNDRLVSQHLYRIVSLGMALLVPMAAVAGKLLYHRLASTSVAVDTRLWDSLLSSPKPTLIVVGSSLPNNHMPEMAETSFVDHSWEPYHNVSEATAVALARVSGILQQHDGGYEIKEDNEVNVSDLRSRPLILIGATNNAWTMRMVGALRYRFTTGPMAQVQDSKNLQNHDWMIAFTKPYPRVSTDYAIVARFHDPTTDDPILVIAGIGPYGTEAASEYATSPQCLKQSLKKLPTGWETGNLEVVLKTDVIAGKAGPPVLVAATTW